jgi:hypothetical protein
LRQKQLGVSDTGNKSSEVLKESGANVVGDKSQLKWKVVETGVKLRIEAN